MSGSPLSNNIVSVALSQAMGTSVPQQHAPPNHGQPFALSSSNGSPSAVVIQPNHEYTSFQTSPASVTVDLPSIQQTPVAAAPPHTNEENGVLLCNLDDLSRYIPENFYTDFPQIDPNHSSHGNANGHGVQMGVPDYLQTVVAGKAITTTVTASSQIPSALPPGLNSLSPHVTVQSQPPQQQPQTITVHLPTQPQPIQGVKTVTYVNKANNNATPSQVSPGKITQYACTPSGERIAITGISAEATKPGSTVQVQVKGGGYQTLQLTAIEPNSNTVPAANKLTVVQELPDVVIQEAKPVRSDDIHSILEDMKQEHPNGDGSAPMSEFTTTAIPVAVTSLASDPKKTTIKRVAAPASTVFLPSGSNGAAAEVPGGAKPRLIFAGNTLPQGAIPIQINGLNAITAVKSIPLSNVISPSSISSNTPATPSASSSSARKPNASAKAANGTKNMVSKVSNNNGSFHKIQSSTLTANINKAIGNNKTCNWVFENGEVCGKTFSKSYNLVVHMRMHEDVRPFGCSLCDQTFRQKAHLQRHETTHGIGPKISNRTTSNGSSGGNTTLPRRKRKRSARGSNPLANSQPQQQQSPQQISANLQQRLARVSEQFSTKDKDDEDSEHSPQPKMRRLSVQLNRCDDSEDPNAAFQPYIATPEEAAAAAAVSQQPRTSPEGLTAAVNAAVHEAISDIQDSIM